jgi:hypothetical protein
MWRRLGANLYRVSFRMRLIGFLLLAGLVFGIVGCGGGGGGAAPQDAIYVDADNDDPGRDGTQANPYKTFTEALADPDLATYGQIRAADGTYNVALGETFPLNIDAAVTVTGLGANRTDVTIAGSGDNVVMILGSGASINHLEVTSASTTATPTVQLDLGTDSARTTVNDCDISGAGGAGQDAIGVSDAAYVAVENSVLAATDAACVNISDPDVDATITGNIMGSAYGVNLTSAATSATAKLRSNTFNSPTAAAVNVEGGPECIVDAGTTDTSGDDPGNNDFNNTAPCVHLRDARGSGDVMLARGNDFEPDAQCGVNIITTPGSGGWDTGEVCESAVYVDAEDGHDDTGTGSLANPYKTITHALEDSRVPTLPIVISGNFSSGSNGEPLPITITEDGVTIQGETGPTQDIVTGDPDDTSVFDIQANDVTLENFRVVSSYNAGTDAARAVRVAGDNALLVDMSISAAGSGAVLPYGVEVLLENISVTLTDCTLTAGSTFCFVLTGLNSTATISGCDFSTCVSGIVISGDDGTQSATVRDCTFTGTVGEAILVTKGSADVGTDSEPGGNTFTLCTIDLSDARASGAQMFAIDNIFSADPPVCGDNILVVGGGGGWSWRVTGGTSGTCP